MNKVLRANPKNLEAISLLAASYWLRNKNAAFLKLQNTLFSLNKNHGHFYYILAGVAEHAHHYQEAVDWNLKALKLNPEHKDAMQALGTNYLHTGQEDKGLSWLKKAYQKDPYNIRTVNILELYQKFIPNEYTFRETPHFKIRYHIQEAELLHRYVGPFLEKAYNDMSKRYQSDVSGKIIIELYKEPEHYSVRTIGVPNLGALAICFGNVITAMSPTSGGNNWKMVLWHELAHVFAIKLSKSKVPRWYTEGLSEYETMRARPEWRREQNRNLYSSIQHDQKIGIESLDLSFTRGKIRNAYFHSSKVIEFIVETYGFEAIAKGLKSFGNYWTTERVLEDITGQSIEKLNISFWKHIADSSLPYKDAFILPTPKSLRSIPKNDNANIDDLKHLESSALKFFSSGNKVLSKSSSKKILIQSPKNRLAHYMLAELAFAESDFDTALEHFRTLLKTGTDSFDIRIRLATILTNRGLKKEAVKQLCAAKAKDPESSYPYQKLAEHHEIEGDLENMLLELESVAALDQSDFGAHLKLLEAFLKLNQTKKAIYYGEKAIGLNPAHGGLLSSLAKAYFKNSSFEKTIFTYNSLLALRPKTRRPAIAELGKAKAYIGLNDKQNALDALKNAARLEPENLEVLTLLKTIQ